MPGKFGKVVWFDMLDEFDVGRSEKEELCDDMGVKGSQGVTQVRNEFVGELNAKVGIKGVDHAESGRLVGEAVVEAFMRPPADDVSRGESYLEVIAGELNADL